MSIFVACCDLRIWVAESLGNYRWAVQLGLHLCHEFRLGRGRQAQRTAPHATEAVLRWLKDHARGAVLMKGWEDVGIGWVNYAIP